MMSEAWSRLVYWSSPVNAPSDVLLDIIRSSERRNARLGCSGVLVYSSNLYAQMIEGPSGSVNHLSQRIKIDPRHVIGALDLVSIKSLSISTQLPMGYVDAAELRRAGLDVPKRSLPVDNAKQAWLAYAVAMKYPSAYCDPNNDPL